jgi:DNA-binding MurR/RpiR family transcriptional regulator
MSKLPRPIGLANSTDSASPSAQLLALFEGHRLTPTQRRIAHNLIRHAAEIPFLNSVEVAELAGVSQPSVTRFAIALGFDGYPELRKRLREIGTPTQPETPADADRNNFQRAIENEIENLRHLADLLGDPSRLLEAGRIMAASRPLLVLGLRSAAAQARNFTFFASKVHTDVRLLDEAGSMLGEHVNQAAEAGATALLCFALPRYPKELLGALSYAREAGLTVITVAGSSFAPVADLSDILLPAPVGTGLVFDTASAALMLGQMLLQALCDALPQTQHRLEAFENSAAARDLFLD